MTVAFLGLGAMGARMAAHVLDAPDTALTVWNRSPERAAPLTERGATVAATPREAAAGAEVVVAMVTDDEASRAVWTGPDGALAGLGTGAVAVEASTLTPAWVRELGAAAAAAGGRFTDAPVLGSRPQADAAALVTVAGGDAAALGAARPVVDAYSGAVHHVGAVGAGAAIKLAVNALFGVQVAAVAELLAVLRAEGLDEARAVEVLGAVPVTSPAARGAMGAIAARAYAPLFPIDLVEKDLGYAAATAAAHGSDVPTTAGARVAFQRAQAAGHGGTNITGVAQVFGG